MNTNHPTGGTLERRYSVIGESALEHRLDIAALKAAITPDRMPAPNYLLQLLDDDVLASSCQTLGQYRAELSKRLRAKFEGEPAAAIGAHTPGYITAPITQGGRAFGLIPVGKGWAEDLINWSTREFRNPADAAHIEACWNAFAGYAPPEKKQVSETGAALSREEINKLAASCMETGRYSLFMAKVDAAVATKQGEKGGTR